MEPTTPSQEFLAAMPKVELHVHIEGAIRPETVLKLARRHDVSLPASTVEGLREWYRFRDFRHFVDVYVAVSQCIRTAEDIELVFREFLEGQKAQNVLHTEATYTACTIEKHCGIPFDEQIDAVERAREYGERALGVTLGVILDIVRGDPVDRAAEVLDWVSSSRSRGVVALGLAGMEWMGTDTYQPVFDEARRRGVPLIAHAGETTGPETVWEVLERGGAVRIGHGVRCYEDPALVEHLRKTQTHLEVCPSSNVCLGVFDDLAHHPIGRMVADGLHVSLNSDDPPMFGTSITEEWQRCTQAFGFDLATVRRLLSNAVEAALVDDPRRAGLSGSIEAAWTAVHT